jgi:hypothetical protein
VDDVTSGQRQWRVRREMVLVKAAGMVLALALLLLNLDDRRAVILSGVAALALAVLIVRDLLVRVRLAAGESGVSVVKGFAGRDRLSWDEIERISVDVNRRYGRRWEHLEIDTGERIYLLGSGALGASCTEVAAELRSMKSAHRRTGGGASPDRGR